MQSKATRFALLACILGFGGCNGGGSTGQQNANVTDAWQAIGTLTVNLGTGMNIEMNLSETTAFLAFGLCAVPSGATVTGTVSGSKVSLTASYLVSVALPADMQWHRGIVWERLELQR